MDSQETITETFAQYSVRLARESRLRKEAIAKEAADLKRKRESTKKKGRRRERELRKLGLSSELMELAGVTKEQIQKKAEAKAATEKEIIIRKLYRICISCCDDKDIKQNGYCEACWNEITYGTIPPQMAVSQRQINSAACRVVRKGHEMS